jgi:hypothetical protein
MTQSQALREHCEKLQCGFSNLHIRGVECHDPVRRRDLVWTVVVLIADWVQQAAEAHAKAFHLAKAPRKLSFAPALGVVELELQIGESVQSFSVSPVLAAIILPFQSHESISAAQLTRVTKIPMETLLRKCDSALTIAATSGG